MIRGASACAVLLVDRLSRCGALVADLGYEAEELDLDTRIARGDRVAAYDAIGAAVDELAAWRERLGDVLAGAETLARIAALAARREAPRC